MADYGALELGHLASMGRAALPLVLGMDEVGMGAIDKLLSQLAGGLK